MKRNSLKLSFLTLLAASIIACSKEENVEKQQIQVSGSLKSGWVPPTSFTDFQETEPNNNVSFANGPVIVGNKIIGSISKTNDLDFFRIICQANVPISFFLDGSGQNLMGFLYDSNGRNVGLIEFNRLFTFTPSFSGIYYVVVNGFEGMFYNLKLTATPELPETESNDSRTVADGPINTGITAYGTIEVQAQCDWFKIYCTQGKIISLYLNGSAIYVNAAIYDGNGTLIRYIDYDKPFLFYPKSSGIYYIAIGGYAGVSYSLKVDNNSGFLIEKEPNNTVSSANGLIYPGTYFEGIADGTSNVYDFVKIEQPQTGPISFYLEGTAIYVNAAIYNLSNEQLGFITDKQSIAITELPAGIYYARIGGYLGVGYKFYVNPK